ncbi:MAG: C39 family peptidase, partial [Ruthenibacterium sp.]
MKRPRFISALLCFLLCSGALLSVPPAHPYLPANAVTYLAVFSPVLYEQAALPERVSLSVAPVFQLPELPNGCEGTSLTAVLRYFGYNADKVDIALNYVP